MREPNNDCLSYGINIKTPLQIIHLLPRNNASLKSGDYPVQKYPGPEAPQPGPSSHLPVL